MQSVRVRVLPSEPKGSLGFVDKVPVEVVLVNKSAVFRTEPHKTERVPDRFTDAVTHQIGNQSEGRVVRMVPDAMERGV